ncbi:ArdC-like ssDNA-binding domain-containing protein [Fictibacillus terranigra]|uniref:ArdC-like ssDNA-binding domain-containing protein n=1 Tax=Fictibacillus terranigra TaxID=3058424 RepID=A0ABT8EBZ6_9BACL|nr:ArdC-like ssDNA-binding domain-containing protein [Fictibacillus sp. CENA-BCM004]MDN4075452.1 ArdC-like ssDNA-binding domain-containing protein [Fictibacillus sp. CENA-BCM004]
MGQAKGLEDIQKRLDQGIQDVMTGEKFQEWLRFLSSFHAYSFNNTILIYQQNPQATLVKGFQEWKKHGRFVTKGAKAIMVLAPLIRKKKEKEEKREGQGKEGKELYGFRYVNVFDVASTDGQDLPAPPVQTLEGDGETEKTLLQDWIKKIEIPVRLEDTGDANGYYHLVEGYIALHEKRSMLQQLKTLIHEYAHHLLHAKGAPFEKENRAIREAQAEAVAYVVLHHFGYETGEYSFGYIAGWTQDLQIMKRIGTAIVSCSHQIIERLEKHSPNKGATA